ncbi:MAG: OmpA family protein [Fibrobacterales bacterium]
MIFSDSKNRLDHSKLDDTFNNDHRYSQKSGGGGYFSSSTSATVQEEEPIEEETDQEPEEEEAVQEQLVSFTNPVFSDSEAARIDEESEVSVEVNYLTDRTPGIVLTMVARYNDEEERGSPISVTPENGIATACIPLAQHQGFYFTENKTAADKVSYTFIATCDDDGTEIASEAIELPNATLLIEIVEVLDSVFNLNSAVPCLDTTGSVVSALSAAFKHMSEFPDKEIVCFGHTDTSGEPDHNLALSEKRAQAVKALISNDQDIWTSAIEGHSTVTDYQTILQSLAASYGWNCDPGTVDGADGENTQAGVKSFQEEYNTHYSGSLTEDGLIGPATWGAFAHTLYELALVASEADPTRITPRFFADNEGIMACGESCPIDQIGLDGFESESNRRVEIHFHDRPNPPTIPAAAPQIDIEAFDSYNQDISDIVHLAIVTRDGENYLDVFLTDQHDAALVGHAYKIVLPDNSELTGELDDEGKASIAIGAHTELDFFLVEQG